MSLSLSRPFSLLVRSDATPAGSVVAFEGNPDTISTQLRLLPSSPQILILPSIECYMPDEVPETDFKAHEYIEKTQNAIKLRNENARAFLQGSPSGTKRLVFLNGGTPTAQALCIKAIMQHETHGDDIKAEAIFNLLVKDGVSGLQALGKDWKRKSRMADACAGEAKSPPSAGPATADSGEEFYSVADDEHEDDNEEEEDDGDEEEDELQDPITRAMRAADALDRLTANLQPSNELDLTLPSRSRSMSLPLYGYADNVGDSAPFMVFGGARQRAESVGSEEEPLEEQYIPLTPNFAVTHFEESADYDATYPDLSDVFQPCPKSPSCVGETYTNPAAVLLSPFGTKYHESNLAPSADLPSPRTPDAKVVFGEASVFDVRSSVYKPTVARVRSLDRILPPNDRVRQLSVPDLGEDSETDGEKQTRPRSALIVTTDAESQMGRVNMINGPRTIVVGPTKRATTITVQPVPAGKRRKGKRSSYVDRGTDAEEIAGPKEPFEPVLPFTEDLVVYLKEDRSNALLDAMVEAFKHGLYPVMEDLSILDAGKPPGIKDSSKGGLDEKTAHESNETQETAADAEPPSSSRDMDDYDPYAYVQPAKPKAKSKIQDGSNVKIVERPPTPAETPPPSATAGTKNKIHDFRVVPTQTAVATQNSLRSILNIYFPPEAKGYHQFHFSLLPELDGLWKPIFREAEPDGSRKSNRKMDQILAFGSQKGVNRDFSAAVLGQIEKLGTKPSGLTRSGRLDFRYLLANAMQAFTAQPLTKQSTDNPFTNSYLLATLIVPHLETYLALHSEVRFLLLEYPQEHLPTVLALQRLVGVDLMKVSQIVDAAGKDLPFTHIRGASLTSNPESPRSLRSNKTVGSKSKGRDKPLPSSPKNSMDVKLSQANFLLTSNASDAEVATFISTIWKILSEISDYYTPVEPLKDPQPKPSTRKLQPPPIQVSSSLSPFPKATGPQSPLSPNPPSGPPSMPAPSPGSTQQVPLPPAAKLPKAMSAQMQSGGSRPPSRASSIAETVKSFKGTRSMRSKHSRTHSRTSRKRLIAADGASVFTFNPEEDSDYDEEERRLMPIFVRRPRKPNSRKALKFLGLA